MRKILAEDLFYVLGVIEDFFEPNFSRYVVGYTLKSEAFCVIYYIKIGRRLHLSRYVSGYVLGYVLTTSRKQIGNSWVSNGALLAIKWAGQDNTQTLEHEIGIGSNFPNRIPNPSNQIG